MKLPRDVSGRELAQALRLHLGYEITRQRGSHLRITTSRNGEHHVTVPMHDPLKVGLLAAILDDVASHFGLSRNDLVIQLFNS
ncbi:addiction module toxin, HicA family [bacterium]|nr:addiction module toxin, HicA family [bacterium]